MCRTLDNHKSSLAVLLLPTFALRQQSTIFETILYSPLHSKRVGAPHLFNIEISLPEYKMFNIDHAVIMKK